MTRKILVIDDDPQTTDYLVALFGDNGYATSAAANADEAFELLQREKPDLITLDLDMPEITGPLFYRKVSKRDEFKDIPVIVISGLCAPQRAIRKVVAAFEKPFDADQLLATVKETIGPGAKT
jgi:CheY-like chemotaxis protein